MPFSARAVLAVAVSLALRAQESCTLQVDGATGGMRVTGDAQWEGGGAFLQKELPSGTWRLRFHADKGIRPAPLELEAPAGGFVHVAVEQGISQEPSVRLVDEAKGPQVFADASGVRVRLSAKVRVRKDGPAIGVAARVNGDDQYRFVFAPKQNELQLLRAMNGPARVMRKCAAPALAGDAEWHELELEVDGFRLACYLDGVLVLRALDGGPIGGVCATFVEGGETSDEAARDLHLGPSEASSIVFLSASLADRQVDASQSDDQVLLAYAQECVDQDAEGRARQDRSFLANLLGGYGAGEANTRRFLDQHDEVSGSVLATSIVADIRSVVPLSSSDVASIERVLLPICVARIREQRADVRWGQAFDAIASILHPAQMEVLRQIWIANGKL